MPSNNPRWNYPPGVTDFDIDRAAGESHYHKSDKQIEDEIDARFELRNNPELLLDDELGEENS